ncbi:hypothetical protein K458DRAFT_413155 [Lentithecium fluviatile CBS 122367]|uniref:Uncharacterized protein n=1 Tax=Lentithecium fluviatile CBS 122367 TaxID=1168545 RepID=A0A6G1JIX1_9PLEO|nr:hypothetical protein K458DRAFT_413155 [Lentithecium fluviatile CBS 122367]
MMTDHSPKRRRWSRSVKSQPSLSSDWPADGYNPVVHVIQRFRGSFLSEATDDQLPLRSPTYPLSSDDISAG